MHGAANRQPASASANQRWWPDSLNLKILHQNPPAAVPLDPDFDYAAAFATLDLEAVKADLKALMTDSQPWWPADYGHYGPLFIRMSWHAAGTYRFQDGRGGASTGNQRFMPLNSWPDNVNLDKARRLLWPVKQKYGQAISWGDLMILAGNMAFSSMGMEPIGFAGGRVDVWEPEDDTYWGSETEWLGDERYTGERQLENPLAAVQMGLIYVNPEGPNGNPDPVGSGRDVQETFWRMGMDDEETVALVAGGHTFGKAHAAGDAAHVGAEPEGAPMEQMGLGWKSNFRSGIAGDAIGSGIEGAWKPHPTTWDHGFFEVLFGYEWELVKSPAGAWQWLAKDVRPEHMVEDAHDPEKKHRPMMTTADLSLRYYAPFLPIAKRFAADPEAFKTVFAKAWFKLTHRDMGPSRRYLGPDAPKVAFLWQEPLPEQTGPVIDESDIAALKKALLDKIPAKDLVRTAWASAATYRHSDKRGGANGARIRLMPQRTWEVNQPGKLAEVLSAIEGVQKAFNAEQSDGKQVSMADLIVLGGSAAVEVAAAKAGFPVEVPFMPGRVDATEDGTDPEAQSYLKLKTDGFRNYAMHGLKSHAERYLVDKAQLLTLGAPEMTVLVGGLRMLNANWDGGQEGVLTDRPGVLSQDFFVNILDMRIEWKKSDKGEGLYEGFDRASQKLRFHATRADLVFGANSQLRAISEVYASRDGGEKFVKDFVKAWVKVMNLDRF